MRHYEITRLIGLFFTLLGAIMRNPAGIGSGVMILGLSNIEEWAERS